MSPRGMSPLLIVVAIVLVDLLGFAIVMPLLPRFAREYDFDATQIGLLLAAYPMLQLAAGPVLGKLSDRFGRRPVLAISQVGTALSFVILGLSTNFWVMLAARMLDGASGGNIIVAQAYIADITKPEHRARSLGLIGAAFGVGFVLGPLMGGLLAGAPVPHAWQLRLPFLVAAGFSALAAALVITSLPESLPADGQARQEARVLSWRGLVDLISLPNVGVLVGVAAVVT
ncbi:MAG TPA: MFS transporter, partial [Isosphaeraceae bacterium]|nr:MFS transporter [Isosphaeraceae bacterium]